jgi:hypothetical protein
MVEPARLSVIVTCSVAAKVVEPGVITGAGVFALIAYVAVATALFVKPVSTAIALIVSLAETEIGLL